MAASGMAWRRTPPEMRFLQQKSNFPSRHPFAKQCRCTPLELPVPPVSHPHEDSSWIRSLGPAQALDLPSGTSSCDPSSTLTFPPAEISALFERLRHYAATSHRPVPRSIPGPSLSNWDCGQVRAEAALDDADTFAQALSCPLTAPPAPRRDWHRRCADSAQPFPGDVPEKVTCAAERSNSPSRACSVCVCVPVIGRRTHPPRPG